MLINLLIQIVNILVAVLGVALVLRVVVSWFRLPAGHPIMRFLIILTEPLVRPLRRTLGNGGRRWTGRGYVDLAPLVALFVLWLAQAVITQVLYWIASPPLWLFFPWRNWERWLTRVIGLLVQIYGFLLLARVLLGWVDLSYTQPVMRFLWNVTEPLLAPIRRRLPRFAGLDFSPVVALLLLTVVQTLIVALIRAVL